MNELAKLQGSQKQIEWATDIRQKFIDRYNSDDFKNYLANNTKLMPNSTHKWTEVYIIVFEQLITKKTQAKFWINEKTWLDIGVESFLHDYCLRVIEKNRKK